MKFGKKKKRKEIFFSLLIFLFFLSSIVSSRIYQPLKVDWKWPIIAHKIYSFDLNQDGEDEIYTCTYSNEQGVIVGLNKSGHLILDHWTVEGYLGQSDYKREEYVKFVWLGDLDNDKDLDILADTEIKGGQLNLNILYRFERELEPGLFIKNIRKWYFDKAQFITQGIGVNIDNDNSKELILSSTDSYIYIFSPDKILKKKIKLPGSVWDILTYDINNNGKLELIAGYFSGIAVIRGLNPKKKTKILWKFNTVKRIFDIDIIKKKNETYILGISEDALYCLDAKGNKKWKKNFKEKNVRGLATFDIDSDGENEILILLDNEIYAFNEDGERKWIFELPEAGRIIYAVGNSSILVSGKNLYSFSLNDEYTKNEIALRYLEEAKKFYENEKCEDALNFAEKAKKIFIEIDNVDALVECDNILIQCSPSPEETEEIKLANEYFSLGEKYYGVEELKKAKFYLEKAFDLYAKWKYREEVFKCDSLLQEINKKLFEKGEAEARVYYINAVEALEINDTENAKFYAEKALKIYQEINFNDGISRVNKLIFEINKKEKEILAESYLKNASKSLEKKDYRNVSKYAEMAKEIYNSLNNSEKIKDCNFFISIYEEYKQAEEYYKISLNYLNNKKYENATFYANKARNLFLKLKYNEGVEKTEKLLKELKEKGINKFFIYLSLLFGIFIFSIIALLLKKK